MTNQGPSIRDLEDLKDHLESKKKQLWVDYDHTRDELNDLRQIFENIFSEIGSVDEEIIKIDKQIESLQEDDHGI